MHFTSTLFPGNFISLFVRVAFEFKDSTPPFLMRCWQICKISETQFKRTYLSATMKDGSLFILQVDKAKKKVCLLSALAYMSPSKLNIGARSPAAIDAQAPVSTMAIVDLRLDHLREKIDCKLTSIYIFRILPSKYDNI